MIVSYFLQKTVSVDNGGWLDELLGFDHSINGIYEYFSRKKMIKELNQNYSFFSYVFLEKIPSNKLLPEIQLPENILVERDKQWLLEIALLFRHYHQNDCWPLQEKKIYLSTGETFVRCSMEYSTCAWGCGTFGFNKDQIPLRIYWDVRKEEGKAVYIYPVQNYNLFGFKKTFNLLAIDCSHLPEVRVVLDEMRLLGYKIHLNQLYNAPEHLKKEIEDKYRNFLQKKGKD